MRPLLRIPTAKERRSTSGRIEAFSVMVSGPGTYFDQSCLYFRKDVKKKLPVGEIFYKAMVSLPCDLTEVLVGFVIFFKKNRFYQLLLL